jgi:hypothetical protein
MASDQIPVKTRELAVSKITTTVNLDLQDEVPLVYQNDYTVISSVTDTLFDGCVKSNQSRALLVRLGYWMTSHTSVLLMLTSNPALSLGGVEHTVL